jgi:hypothetical protein
MLTYMNDTYLKPTLYSFSTGDPLANSGMLNDLTPTPAAQINGTTNAMNFNPDLSTTTNLVQYLRAYYSPRPYIDNGVPLNDAQAQANVVAANASIATTGYEYCVINDETSATVTAKGVYLGKVSDFVSYFVAKSYLTANYSTTAVCNTAYYSMAAATSNGATITAQGAAITMIQGQLVSLGLLTVANGVYSVVASVSTMASYMRLTGVQTLTGNLSFLDDTYTFSGAKPSQIGYLS